jgi:hypothetical protein
MSEFCFFITKIIHDAYTKNSDFNIWDTFQIKKNKEIIWIKLNM